MPFYGEITQVIWSILDALKAFTDVGQWYFVFAPPEEIKTYYKQLNLVDQLGSDLGTPNVYILDKERNLRGRKEKKVKNPHTIK